MLGIVILNYNTWFESLHCIESILENYDLDCMIYLVDNCSAVEMPLAVKEKLKKFQNIKMIFAVKNRGYSAGNNLGIAEALRDACDNILICNSDIIFIDKSIKIMETFLKSNANVGIVGPQIYNSEDVFQPFYMLSKLTGIGKLQNMILHTPLRKTQEKFKKNFIREVELVESMEVFGVSGCCFLMSRECAEFLYPLDEHTFLYEEEYIIGVRLEKSNFKIYIVADTHVLHLQGVSTGGMSEFAYDCLIESEQYYLKEYLNCNFLLRNLIFFIRKTRRKKMTKGH